VGAPTPRRRDREAAWRGAAMNVRECHVELLLGRLVRDSEGAKVGRIEEIVAGMMDGETVVKEYLVGEYGLLARMDVLAERSAIRAITWILERVRGDSNDGYAVRWNQMDLSDPDRPVTTVPKSELKARA
jgi:hypothetical protein